MPETPAAARPTVPAWLTASSSAPAPRASSPLMSRPPPAPSPSSPRPSSPCLLPAAAAVGGSAADSGRGHGVVTIGYSTPRGVALRLGGYSRRDFSFITMASRDHSGLTRQLLDFQHDTVDEVGAEHDPFMELKERFMDFKQRNCVEKFSNYQSLAQQQTPKFMVVACADSRVCPTSILGFQPGEAFTVRNVANLVPPYEHGGSETSAALEFAVNSLEVQIYCRKYIGGRSFIKNWVSIGKSARLSTKAAAGNLSFEMQCRHCEKESINSSLLNLLTYPWIEKRVNEGTLNLHGGWYNFVDCIFEKWTLVYREELEGGSKYAIKNRSTWS
ncbi:Beta carbonic anhydrase 5, chloroplastic [Dichanthelium oligosanthes]|uniref:Carbonic anhydrase n=1 Tax=Dichanthelium oligosanthes TaxID=888268 RepID=A0A1E5W6T6_9POAL|nr:Beta carbonic anhydrase 5, chloroplastic [Dichanthelium oligosanthes]